MSAPLKTMGPDKWAADGFQSLKDHVGDEDKDWLDKNKSLLMVDDKAKKLLITGSQFQPGSRPLDDVIKHLKKRFKK